MSTFTVISFNAHAGLRPLRNKACVPYDLRSVLLGFDADVIVMQESWWPDDGMAVVDDVAADLGAKVFSLPFGRGTVDPWPHCRRDGSGEGELGLSIITKLPAEEVRHTPLGQVW